MKGRCWGLNRNLRRCGRYGKWRFFCEDHRRQPILALIFLVFTVGGGAASIQSAWFPHLWTRVPPPVIPQTDKTSASTTTEKELLAQKGSFSEQINAKQKAAVLQKHAASTSEQKQFPKTLVPTGSGSSETFPGIRDSVGVMVSPATRGLPKQLSFTTGGAGSQEFSFEERPTKLLFESLIIVVEEKELPKTIKIGNNTATIIRFTDKGFILDDHGVGISGKATLLEAQHGIHAAD